MSVCWACAYPLPEGVLFCSSCGVIQPPNPQRSHFEVLGIQAKYQVDLGDLERRFKDLSRQLHPDRFVLAEPAERRYSLLHTTAVNDAYRHLRVPRKRAEYLMALWGRPVTEQSSRTAALPLEFLEEVMELRERLAEAHMAGDRAALESELKQVRGILAELDVEIEQRFHEHLLTEPTDRWKIEDRLEYLLHRQKYLSNIVAEHGA